MPLINKKLVLAARPDHLIKESDFRMESEDVAQISDGEILIKTLFLSLAPVMKFYMMDGAGFENPLQFGDTMRGRGVGKVIESKHPDFKIGDIVQGKFGWQEYVISTASAHDMMYPVADTGYSPSLSLGLLGMTGFTSYVGLFTIGALKEGENVLVSAAAGGVGSNCGHLAKIKNAKVIGLASTDAKCKILVEKLGYDGAINYRSENLSERIDHFFPDGIDVYFDNVGGEILDIALTKLKRYARVVECGRISSYKESGQGKPKYALENWHMIGGTRSRMEGFFIYDYEAELPAAIQQMAQWMKEEKLNYQEDILEGLDKMPQALNRLFEGKNVGKQLVKIGDV